MAEHFQFELVSPERLLLSDEVLEVVVPGTDGEFGVLKNHSPFMSTIKPGVLKVRKDGGWTEFFVRGGFADAGPGGLTVLAERAIAVADIKRSDLDQQIKNAEEDVADAQDDDAKQKAEMHLSQLKDVAQALNAA